MENDDMYADFTCPVRLIQSSSSILPDTSRLFELTLLNTSGKTLDSLSAVIVTEAVDNEQIDALPISATGLDVEPRCLFRLSPMLPPNSYYHHYDILIRHATFTDGSKWECNPDNVISVSPRLTPDGAEKTMRVAICGKDALYTPQSFDNYWICVCGFPNDRSSNACASCGRQKKAVFASMIGEGLEREFKQQAQKSGGAKVIYPAGERYESVYEGVHIDSTPRDVKKGAKRWIIPIVLIIIVFALIATSGLWLDKAKEILGIAPTVTNPPYVSLLKAYTPEPTSEAEARIQEALSKENNTAATTATPTPEAVIIPTAEPTAKPTEAPTKAPTTAPTVKPTEAPTQAPTIAPTEKPTEAPTKAPTTAPTEKPTEAPTKAPTTAPTATPTMAPTKAPTPSPTQKPTNTPTVKPTPAPTIVPTLAPKVTPTPFEI